MNQLIDWKNLSASLSRQEEFSSLFFNSKDLTLKQKQELLKTFVISLHSETTGICEAVNYKDHRCLPDSVDVQKILYKSVDIYRYVLAILNLWGIDDQQFITALKQKDDFLHYRHRMSQKSWQGQPIVLLDLDDVMADFRDSFFDFVNKKYNIVMHVESEEYYSVSALKENGIANEEAFKSFIDDHGLAKLAVNRRYRELMNHLKASGYWIQVVTARPADNLVCFYDTYSWLSQNDLQVDAVTFTPEKFRWLSEQKFYNSAKFFAVDDSSKHAMEYAKHGVKVIVPQQTYNKDVIGLKNIVYVPQDANPIDFIPNL
jgi:hypothetical protein